MKIAVARISKPRGFKGELTVIPYKPDTQSLKVGLRVTLQKGEFTSEYVIESVKLLRDRIGLKLAGIENDKDAFFWKGGDLLVEQDRLASLDMGEYYHFQLEGCEVFEENGKMIGTVSAVETFGANDLLRVKLETGEALVPFVKEVVRAIDIDRRKIVIRRIEGLY